MTKRILALLAAFLLLFCSTVTAVSAEAEETAAHQIEMKSYPFYLISAEQKAPSGFPLYFADGAEDLPFVNLQDWVGLMVSLAGPTEKPYLTLSEQDGLILLIRDNGSLMSFNFAEGTVLSDDFIAFQQDANQLYLDIARLKQGDPQNSTFPMRTTDSRIHHGNPTLLNLKEYGIPMIEQDGLHLVPLQTLRALSFSESGLGIYFNGEAVMFTVIAQMQEEDDMIIQGLMSYGLVTQDLLAEARQNTGSRKERLAYVLDAVSATENGQAAIDRIREMIKSSLAGMYMSGPKAPRSEALAAYGYGELCMELDMLYGLKESHHISGFADYFAWTGLTAKLLDPDAGVADSAVGELMDYWLDDGHSGFLASSSLSEGRMDGAWKDGFNVTSGRVLAQHLAQLRGEYPEASLPYYEIGNTAFVTFDEFRIAPVGNSMPDYYELDAQDSLPDDTLSLLIRAHREITRENSPIENVVLDLSNNGGGNATAAVFTLCWFLGDAQASIFNTATNAQATISYQADVNLDHVFDEKDSVSNLNLYCLISPQSFSCGNLVPWAFKADGRVTLLGKVSGGGSCVVRTMTSAWGTSYQMSGSSRISFVKNGSYYDVDRGVDPDFFIRDYRHFFNREALAAYINGLY